MNESRLKRQYTGGHIIYGYDVVDKKFVVNQVESQIVQNIYNDYIDGQTIKQIRLALKEKGILTKTKKDFSENVLLDMIHNNAYIGIATYCGIEYPNTYPRIINQETYDRMQKLLERNKLKLRPKTNTSVNFLLSGKLFCGKCKESLSGDTGTSKTGKSYHYYACRGNKRFKKCDLKRLPKDYLKNTVFDVCKKVFGENFIPQIVDIAYNLQLENNNSNVTIINLENRLKENQKRLKNMVKAIEMGIFNEETNERMLEIKQTIEDIKEKLEIEQNKQATLISKEKYTDFLTRFFSKKIENEKMKKALFDLLIKRIIIFDDKIRVTFNLTDNDDTDDTEVELNQAKEELENLNNNMCSTIATLRTTQYLLISTHTLLAERDFECN